MSFNGTRNRLTKLPDPHSVISSKTPVLSTVSDPHSFICPIHTKLQWVLVI